MITEAHKRNLQEKETHAMPTTTTQTTFRFEELSETAQETAINAFWEANTDHEWWDFLFDEFRTVASILGIDVKDTYFSGFYGQGDGASFTGTYEYRPGWRKALAEYAPQDTELLSIGNALQEAQRRAFYSITARIIHRGHYRHSGCMVVDADAEGAFDHDTITDQLRLLADWIYSKLEREYEYLTGEDAIKETIIANEWEFTEDGNPA